MALKIVVAFPVFYLIIAFGILATIAWIFSLATNNGVITVCTATIRKTCQSKNKLAAIYHFRSINRFFVSICVFYACLITCLFSQNAFSHLNLKLLALVFNADNLHLTLAFKNLRYTFKGPEKLLQQKLPYYLVSVQFVECINAAYLLNIRLIIKEGTFSRPRFFYFLVTACAMLFWLCSWFVPTSHYSALHDVAKTQHSLFQIRFWICQMFGKYSVFSPDMKVECFTAPRSGRAFFIAKGDIDAPEIIFSVSLSLLRFFSRFLVIIYHLDYNFTPATIKTDNAFRHGQIDCVENEENPHQINMDENPIKNESIIKPPTKKKPDFFLCHDKEEEENCSNVPNDGDPNSKSELPSDCSTPKATQNVNSLRPDRTQEIIDPTTYRSSKLASSSPFAEVSFNFGIGSEIAKVAHPVHLAGDKTEPQQQHHESCDTEQPAGVGNLVTVKGNVDNYKLNKAVLPPPIVDISSSSIYSDIVGDDLQASALPPNSAPGTHDCSELKYAHDDSFDQNVANYCKPSQNDSCSQTSPDGAYTSYSTVRPEPGTMRNSRNVFPSSRPKQAPPRPQRSEEEMSFPSIEGILVDPALQTLQYGKMNVRVVSARKPDY